MMEQIERRIAPRFACALMLLFAVFSGCEKKPPASVSRGQDPVYQEQLKALRAEQNSTAKKYARVKARMDDVRRRVKANLGAAATDEQIEAEIVAHPERYPACQTMTNLRAEVEKAAERDFEKARTTVRDRILKERLDRAAVGSKK